MNKPLHIISLGAGVQSSTMALMAAEGEITPMPDAAIFADTGAEPAEVYTWLAYLIQALPFEVHIRQWKDGLRDDIYKSLEGGRFASAPFFTESANGGGKLRRQCTNEYKIQPINRCIREELMGLERGQRAPKGVQVVTWQGISTDEIQRARTSILKWQEFRYPLLEQRMSRQDCLKWMEKNNYPKPPRSACIWCPFHSDNEWRRMKSDDPESWKEAIRMDAAIRDGVRGTKERLFLHRSLVPIDQVDLSTAADHGQSDMFEEECQGMCGL